jgi:radical SAM superfamily enzyme YgiQ (UPF0313 family)
MEQRDALLVRLSKFRLFSGHLMDQMGLLYVATYATTQGFSTGVIDHTPITLATIADTIRESGARVVGFYVDHENVFPTMSAIGELKAMGLAQLAVVGGPQASVSPWDERILRESRCDIAVRGEGEEAFTEILRWFLKGQGSAGEILGVTYRDNGEIRRTPPRPLRQDLDCLPPPDRNLKQIGPTHTGVDYLVTSRGCPYGCAFCYEGRPEATYRVRSIANVLAEVDQLLQHRKPSYINILDDTFMVKPSRVMEFCYGLTKLQAKHYKVHWFCEGRANVIAKHPEMIQAAVEAGLSRVQLGVETGTQAVLDAYRKDLTLDQIRSAVKVCGEAGVLSIFGNFIVGGAFETWNTIQATIAFMQELHDLAPGRFETSSTIYTPYPGTAMYDHPELFGLATLDQDCVTGPGDNYPFTRTAALSKWEILHARQLFLEAVSKKMMDLLPKLPYEVLQEHVSANYRIRLRTAWFSMIEQIFHYQKYFNMPYQEEYLHFRELPADRFESFKPVRTVMIGASQDGELIVNLGYKKLQLNEVGTFILEHSYGKLTNAAIIDRVWRRYFSQADREVVREIVREFFSMLDSERVVVFTLV